MDNTMVKRGIGAVVLAIIAALLLGYLLKDKSRERQGIVEMNLPGATDGKISSLSDVAENAGTVISDGGDSIAAAGSSATETGSKVIAAATTETAVAAAGAIANSARTSQEGVANKANQIANNNRPGFSIRPAAQNEQREIIDINGKIAPNQPAESKANKVKTDSHNTATKKSNETVVANATGKAQKSTYKPRLIKERKRAKIVSSANGSTKTKQARATTTSTRTTKKNVAIASKGRTGYAIQLLATSSQSRASKLRNTMKSEGYDSYVTHTKSNNKVLYRVRIGVKGNRNTAISFQQKMKRRYRKNYNVQNSLVVSN